MKIDNYTIGEDETLKKVMNKIDLNDKGIAIIIKKTGDLVGVITNGDIRRAILNGSDVDSPIMSIVNKNPLFVEKSKSLDKEYITEILNKAKKRNAMFIPIVDSSNKVINLISSDSIEKNNLDMALSKKQKTSVLIVGGAGYLGSVIALKLLKLGYKVRVLDIGLYGFESLKDMEGNVNFELIKGDMRNITTVTNSLKDIDTVINLAAIVGDPATAKNPKDTIEINYLANIVFAEACKYQQINRFIFASTCSVYGVGEDLLTEESPLRPVSLYARSKIRSEEAILKMKDENFSPTIMRMSTLFGPSPRMRFDLVVNTLTARSFFDNEISIFGGNQWRPLLHVEDAADSYIKVIEAPIEKVAGECFNVGSSKENYQIIKLVDFIKEVFPDVKVNVEEDDFDMRDYKVSFQKIKNVLNYEPVKSVKDGITEIKEAIISMGIKTYKDKKYSNSHKLPIDNKD